MTAHPDHLILISWKAREVADDSAPRPLSAQEEQTWRAFIKLLVRLPRAIDEDLQRRGGVSLTRYIVLMRLSETSDRALRMSELAEAASISPSRLTRIVQAMAAEGLVTRGPDPTDARASVVTLTDRGRQVLRDAWPAHLAGVRSLVMDHVAPTDLPEFARMVTTLLTAVEARG